MLGSLTSTKVRELLFLCLRFISLPAVTIICLLFSVLMPGESFSATYYLAINGSDSNSGSATSPWATFSQAITRLQPGDTLMIMDGTYYQSLNVSVSGTQGTPITIKAQNDGKAIIDGEHNRTPLTIASKNYITVEGIVFKRGTTNVIDVSYSSYITLRRVSAYSNNYNIKGNVFLFYYSDHILLEDCVASGWGRNMFLVTETNYATLRRCWAGWKGWYDAGNVGGDNLCVQLYGSSNGIVENLICTRTADAMNVEQMGVNAWCNDWNNDASNNKYLGSVIANSTSWAINNSSCKARTLNNQFIDVAVINSAYGIIQRGDASAVYQNMTLANITNNDYFASPSANINNQCPKNSDYEIGATIKNVSSLNAAYGLSEDSSNYPQNITHKYNNYYNVTNLFTGTSGHSTEYCSNGCGYAPMNPAYNTATYGKGAYLMVPSALKGKGENGANIGATVLYRYQDGVLTSTPLWPWPMEDRIKAETGYSVTWEANGGLWKTLDGVYAGTPVTPTVDTTPPSIPTALAATVISSTQINLSWTASTDPAIMGQATSEVAGYNVYRNGTQIATTSNTNYSDTGLSPSTTYSYTVSAFDAAGNVSAQSVQASATTQSESSKSYTVLKTAISPIIDGDCSEFRDANSIQITNGKETGIYKFLWDNSALYGCAYVNDTKLNASITTRDGDLYMEDSMELFFDTLHDAGGTLNANDYKFLVNILNTQADAKYDAQGASWDITWTSKVNYTGTINNDSDIDSGYVIEFKIPWSSWGIAAPSANDTRGFDISLNAKDALGNTQTEWANTTGGGSNDPDGWGDMIFSSTVINQPLKDNTPPSTPNNLI